LILRVFIYNNMAYNSTRVKIVPIVGIYSITNPLGEMYIGRSEHIHRRWNQHTKERLDVIIKLFNSFELYGRENHVFAVIEECNISELVIKEAYYQNLYNTFEIGLNSKPKSKYK